MSSTLAPTGLSGDPLKLTMRPLPKAVPWVVGGAAVVLAAVLIATGVNPLLAGFLAVLLFGIVLPAISARIEGSRRATDRLVTVAVSAAFALAILPLLSLLWTTVSKGIDKLTPYFLQHSMKGVGPRDTTGGAYHAIIGTVEQVAIASLIAVPIGLLVAVYLVEYGRGTLAKLVTFFVDVMTGVPSIVSGLFIFTLFLIILGFDYSGLWAGVSLSILMLPVVVRGTEEMLKLVPNELREAAFALGVPKWKTILSIVFPTAIAGVVTGVMLSVARVIGETAPLILTAGFTAAINSNPFHGAQVALPLYVFTQAQQPSNIAVQRAWAGALTLIIIVMVLNLVARGLARWKAPKAH